MKKVTQLLFFIAGFFFCGLQAMALPFAAARLAFGAGRFAVRHGLPVTREALKTARPLVKKVYEVTKPKTQELYQAAKPYLLQARQFAKENPKEALRRAAFIGGGAAAGYYTSDDGIINTTMGIGLGAAAGAFGAGLHATHRVTIALQTELAAAYARQEALAYEGAALRNQLGALGQALEQKTGQWATERVGLLQELKKARNPELGALVQKKVTAGLERVKDAAGQAKTALELLTSRGAFAGV